MKIKKIALWLVLIALVVGGYMLFVRAKAPPPVTVDSPPTMPKTITVYRSASCGCCGQYISYLKKNGFTVTVQFQEDTALRRTQWNVPSDMGSCHTSVIGDYVVEGHVPVEAIKKLFQDKPAIRGIALPGMPIGSPGMPGKKKGIFDIFSFTPSGETADFMSI